jgi:hypothetical protein
MGRAGSLGRWGVPLVPWQAGGRAGEGCVGLIPLNCSHIPEPLSPDHREGSFESEKSFWGEPRAANLTHLTRPDQRIPELHKIDNALEYLVR